MGIAGGIKLEISANFAVFLVVCLTSLLGLLVWIMAPAKEAPEFVPKGEALDINVCRKKLRNAISTLCPKTGKRYLVIGYVNSLPPLSLLY